MHERDETLAAVRRMVLAAMETGNTAQARTLVTELAAVDSNAAKALRADVVAAYGQDI